MNHKLLFPLDKTPLLESNNYEEAEAMLAQLIGPCKSEFLEPHSHFLTRYYHANFNQSTMIYLSEQSNNLSSNNSYCFLHILFIIN